MKQLRLIYVVVVLAYLHKDSVRSCKEIKKDCDKKDCDKKDCNKEDRDN